MRGGIPPPTSTGRLVHPQPHQDVWQDAPQLRAEPGSDLPPGSVIRQEGGPLFEVHSSFPFTRSYRRGTEPFTLGKRQRQQTVLLCRLQEIRHPHERGGPEARRRKRPASCRRPGPRSARTPPHGRAGARAGAGTGRARPGNPPSSGGCRRVAAVPGRCAGRRRAPAARPSRPGRGARPAAATRASRPSVSNRFNIWRCPGSRTNPDLTRFRRPCPAFAEAVEQAMRSARDAPPRARHVGARPPPPDPCPPRRGRRRQLYPHPARIDVFFSAGDGRRCSRGCGRCTGSSRPMDGCGLGRYDLRLRLHSRPAPSSTSKMKWMRSCSPPLKAPWGARLLTSQA